MKIFPRQQQQRRGARIDCRKRRNRHRLGNRCFGQRHGLARQSLGRKPPAGVARDIVCRRQIGLACRLEPRHPAPRQRVRRRIGIDQMTQEEIRAQRPRQPQGENPDRRKPHARMIVEIAGLGQFARPVIEPVDAGRSRFGCGNGFHQATAALDAVTLGHKPRPDLGPHVEPPFPVGPPQHFLHEFFGHRARMPRQDGSDDFLLRHQTVAYIRRQHRDIGARIRPVIGIAPVGINPPGAWDKIIEARKTRAACWREGQAAWRTA